MIHLSISVLRTALTTVVLVSCFLFLISFCPLFTYLEHYPSLLNGGLGNLFLSEGKASMVFRVEVKERIGEERSFTQASHSCTFFTFGLLEDGGVQKPFPNPFSTPSQPYLRADTIDLKYPL